MSDSAGLAVLLASRGPAAVLFGASMGALLWLLTLLRLRGATVAAALIAIAFLARGWGAAELLTAVLAGAGLTAVLAADTGTGDARRPGARDVVGLALVATVAMVIASQVEPRGTWLAAAAGALAAGAACWVLVIASRAAGEAAVRVTWFRDPAGGPAGVPARAVALAAVAATLVVTGAFEAHVLGPGAPAPVGLGALLSLALLALGAGTAPRLAASVTGAALGAALATFLA